MRVKCRSGTLADILVKFFHFCRVAAAGSKEARELEKVKKAFEKVYRENIKLPSETKFSFAGLKSKTHNFSALEQASRLDYTAEQRKNTRPDIDKTDVVFAEGGVSYSQEYESAKVNDDIISLIEKVKTHDYKDNEKVELGIVSEKTAKEIKEIFGVDVSGYKMVIEARQVYHILKNHGIYSKSDQSMSNDTDIAKMEYAIRTYDEVRDGGKTQAYSYMKNGHNKTAPTILYEKEIGEKSYYVIQTVPETKKELCILSQRSSVKKDIKMKPHSSSMQKALM